MIELFEGDASACHLGQDLLRGGGPDEGGAFGVVRVEVFLDLGDEVGDGEEHSTAQGFIGEFPEKPLDQIQP